MNLYRTLTLTRRRRLCLVLPLLWVYVFRMIQLLMFFGMNPWVAVLVALPLGCYAGWIGGTWAGRAPGRGHVLPR